MTRLHLHEELLLMGLRDQKGTVATGAMVTYAIAGAALAELMLAERLESVGEGRHAVVHAVGDGELDDPILKECWQLVHDAKKPLGAARWVGKFATLKKLNHRVAQPLVERGILEKDERKVLFLFSQTIYPEADGRPEEAIWKRLERAIFSDDAEVDARTAVLLSIADAAGILRVGFDKKELKASKERIASVIAGEKSGAATREVVNAAATAAVMAAVMPAIIVTTVTSN